MDYVDNFLPYFTGDGSVGLFSEEFDDIYHSSYGALSEAYEKFADAIPNISKQNLRVLDICYGLGYNTKAFLNQNFNKNIMIDCLDIDKNLLLLSPFIKTNFTLMDTIYSKIFPNYGKENLPKKINKKIKSYISKSRNNEKYIINDKINHLLIKNLYEQFGEESLKDNLATKKKFIRYFNKNAVNFMKFYIKNRYKFTKNKNKSTFLHNIYYRYLSKRYKYLFNNNIKFNFYIDDARNTVKNLNKKYDYIFLDAFTTDKCPQLWSQDFINNLYKLLNTDGALVTYSCSVIVRSTMRGAGFYVGKIINKNNKVIGTICSKNNNLINNKLNNYEIGLMNTKAGIPYRDVNLDADKDTILKLRDEEIKNSSLLSSSKYIKKYKEKLYEI